MEKKGTGKFAIRVWGWPTLILILLQWGLMALFVLTSPDKSQYFLEPESGREKLFEGLLGVFYISYMWVLICRYKKMTDKKMLCVTKWGVILLTALFFLGIMSLLHNDFRIQPLDSMAVRDRGLNSLFPKHLFLTFYM